MFTYAPDKCWAGIFAQVSRTEKWKEVGKQNHECLAFRGEPFSITLGNWTTYGKEAFEIIKFFEIMDYPLWGPNPVRRYTDRGNLLYVLAPLAFRPNAPRYVLAIVHRWVIHMSRFKFVIEHVHGFNDVFADLLTKWSQEHRVHQAVCWNIAGLL